MRITMINLVLALAITPAFLLAAEAPLPLDSSSAPAADACPLESQEPRFLWAHTPAALNGKVEMARRAGYRPRGRVRRMYVQEARGFVWVIDITRSR